MKVAIVFAALVVVACAQIGGIGGPQKVENPMSKPISQTIINKAKNINKAAQKVELTGLTVNSATQYNLWEATLKVDGKTCKITVSEQSPLQWIEGPAGCVLCC